MKNFNIQIGYKLRNILSLSFILLIVLSVGGYYALFDLPDKIEVVDKQIADLQAEIDQLEFVGVQLEETEQKIFEEQLKLTSIDKQIVAEISPASTYQYLNDILKLSGFLKFDMIFNGVEKRKKYKQNVYNVKGEGRFSSIYKFIAHLEQGPQTYKIRKIQLRGVESINVETERQEFIVTFEMELLALFAQVRDLPKISRRLGDIQIAGIKNPLYPKIRKDLPPNFYDLLEVERAELKAIMPGKAFVVDHKRNTHILHQGDEVYLGYVKSIDEKENRVTFTLDKGGIFENFVLELRFNNDKNER